MSSQRMLNNLATIASNLDNYDGVFVLTFKRSEDDDSISFMASGDNISYLESVGLGKLFSNFIEIDAVSRKMDQDEDDEEDDN
jgi:hypothetical protein